MSREALVYGHRGQADGRSLGVDVTTPVAGFYQGKMRSGGVLVGIRLWFGPPCDPVTGEELDRSPRWQAEVNGKYEDDFDRVWPACARDPITEDQYRFYSARQGWAERNAPDSSFANPRRRHDPLTSLLPF